MTPRDAAVSAAGLIGRAARSLSGVAARAEWLVWLLVAATILVPRAWLISLCPVYIWSDDSAGYLQPALRWLEGGGWTSDPRRGPIYSAFLGLAIGATGDLASVVWIQQALGGLSLLALCVALRARFGRGALLPVLFCGACAGFYGLPLYLAQLVRNETLLLAGSAMAFLGLYSGLSPGAEKPLHPRALVAAGLGGALVNLTKNVFLPWPLLGLAALLWAAKNAPRTRWVVAAALFLGGYALPTSAAKVAEKLAPGSVGGVSYAGIQLYGRVAQWTVLDGGIHPEIKEAIRPLVLEYRAREKPDNNWVIKRGIVPVIGRTLAGPDKQALDRVCRALAVEAIRAQPRAFAAQALGDFGDFLFEMGWKEEVPKIKTFRKLVENLEEIPHPHPAMKIPETVARYREMEESRFSGYHRAIRCAALFEAFPPVLATSLLLPLLFALDRRQRPFWFAAAGIWFFNLLLLSTVGKPMHRYLLPLLPVMLLAMGSALCGLWLAAARLGQSPPRGGDRQRTLIA